MNGGSRLVLVLIVTVAGMSSPTAAEEAQPAVAFSATALAQLEAVYAEKLTRDPAQKKMDTALVLAVRESRRDPFAAGIPRIAAHLRTDKTQRIEVDIRARVTADLLAHIAHVGGEVVSSFPQYRWVRAYVSTDGIALIAERSDVREIRHAVAPMFHKINTSQGDVAHRASNARLQFGVNGSGVKVGSSLTASSSLPHCRPPVTFLALR